MTTTIDLPSVPMVLPDIPTTPSKEDVIRSNRERLLQSLGDPNTVQCMGLVEGDSGAVCFVGLGKRIAESL